MTKKSGRGGVYDPITSSSSTVMAEFYIFDTLEKIFDAITAKVITKSPYNLGFVEGSGGHSCKISEFH